VSIVKQWGPMLGRGRQRYETWRLARIARQAIAAVPLPATPGLDEATRQQALVMLGGLVPGYRDLRWHEALARLGGRPSASYLPDDIFACLLMPGLNPRERTAILGDKNHFDRLDGVPSPPATVGRLMNGRLLDLHYRAATAAELTRYLLPETALVVKPTRVTGGGKGVAFVEAQKLAEALADRTDAIIQLPVAQHRDLAVLNMSSLNTLRIVTWRKLDGEVVHLGSLLNVGRAGARVDKSSAGGLFCGIDAERGVLQPDAFTADYRAVQAHPDNGLLFAGRKVPSFATARDAFVAAHRQLPWIDIASWDAAIDSAGLPVTIGVDAAAGIFGLQLGAGPVFEPVLDDIRQRIGKRRYSGLAGFL